MPFEQHLWRITLYRDEVIGIQDGSVFTLEKLHLNEPNLIIKNVSK